MKLEQPFNLICVGQKMGVPAYLLSGKNKG